MRKWILNLGAIVTFCLFSSSVFCSNNESSTDQTQEPSYEVLKSGRENYQRYCANCHGENGEGKEGPAIAGSLIVTGPMSEHIHFVLKGNGHTSMPSWGLTQLSDEVLANILTYQRNAWGNNDKDTHGKDAGGVVTPEMVKKHRDELEKKTTTDNIRL